MTLVKRLSILFLWAVAAFGQGLVNGARGFPQLNDTNTGTTFAGTAIITSIGSAINAGTSSSSVKTYIVISPTSVAAGNAILAINGSIAPCTMDSTIAAGGGNYYVINSPTTATECHAQATPPAAGVWIIGFLHDQSSTVGLTSLVEVSGQWSSGPGTTHAFVISAGPNGQATYPTVPSTVGQWNCFYNITTAGAVDPTCSLAGFGGRSVVGSTVTDTVLFSDNLNVVVHDNNATACLTTAGGENLPTPTSLQNSSFGFSYSNQTANCQDTVTPAGGFTINSNASQIIGPNVFCRIYLDPNSSVNWLADCSNSSSGAANPFTMLTDAPTVNWSVSGLDSKAEVTLTGNRSLSISGATNGWEGTLFVTQGAGGSHTLTLPIGNSVEGGAAGVLTLSSVAGRIDRLAVNYDGTNFYWDTPHLNYTASAGGATFNVINRVSGLSNSGCTSALSTTTFGTTGTAGEGIFVEYYAENATGPVVISDSASQTYTKAYELGTPPSLLNSHYTVGFAYFLTSANGVTKVTMSAPGSIVCALAAEHVTRSTGSWAIDQTGAASSTAQASPWSSPTRTTTAISEILLGGAWATGSGGGGTCALTATGSWTGTQTTGDGNGTRSILLDQTVSSLQTIAATGTTGTCTSPSTYPGMVTFK